MITNSREIGKKLLRNVRSAALVVSLALSAYLISVALRAQHFHWLAWTSFLPLFVVVRSPRPAMAVLAGGLCGVCLYLFSAAGSSPVFSAPGSSPAVEALAPAAGLSACVYAQAGPSAGLLALLIVIPAVYVGLAARPAGRRAQATYECAHTESSGQGYRLRSRKLTKWNGDEL